MKNKKPFYVMVIVIIIMYTVIYILRPAPVSGQPVSGVFDQITPVAPVQPDPVDIEEEEYWDSLELLAICVEAEAGNQGLQGKRLVADVILNRAEDHSGQWPDTIARCDIPEKSVYVFLGWRDGRYLGTVRGDVPGGKNGSRTERISGNLLFPGRSVV